MLALGFAGGLLDMELVVHSDRRKHERPTREAEALKSIGGDHSTTRDGAERHAQLPSWLSNCSGGVRRDEELVERYELPRAEIRAEMGAAMG